MFQQVKTTLKEKFDGLIALIILVAITCFSQQAYSAKLKNVSYNTMQNDEIALVFTLSETITIQPTVKTSLAPARIDISFEANDFNQNLAETLVSHAGVQNIIVRKMTGKVIASVNLDQLSVFDVSQKSNTFTLKLNKGISNKQVMKVAAETSEFINKLASIDFKRSDDNAAQVLVNLEDSMVAVDVADRLGKIYVEFHNTEILDDLLYMLDVSDFGTLVRGIETFREGKNARLVVDISGEFTFEHQQINNVFSLKIKNKVTEAGFLDELEDFSGKAISLNFQDISVRTVLQIIADYNGFNLVTSDTVIGLSLIHI